MGWREFYEEEAVARAERLVASLIGTTTVEKSEAFGNEINEVYAEVVGLHPETIQLIASLAGLAQYAVMLADYRGRCLDTYVDPSTPFDNSDAAVREGQVRALAAAADGIREIARTNFFKNESGGNAG